MVNKFVSMGSDWLAGYAPGHHRPSIHLNFFVGLLQFSSKFYFEDNKTTLLLFILVLE